MKMISGRAGVLVVVLLLSGTALADTYVKGTQVSYSKEINTSSKANESSLYIDEANDTSNENYAEFTCDAGAPIFYLNSSQRLVNRQQFDNEETPDITVAVDGGKPIRFHTWGARSGDKPNLMALALDDKYDAQMLRLFQNARSKVVMSLTRYDKKVLNL
ncbi:hypothetical protein [Deinococcus sp.]|uniref:hypothetical protein n=1 Tax=Deinococcus sp. TaxID=47478 RepID=UPI0025C0FE7E|nr:hypothetical protein [Deinococcus sp.]